jgi:hypothetical protein
MTPSCAKSSTTSSMPCKMTAAAACNNYTCNANIAAGGGGGGGGSQGKEQERIGGGPGYWEAVKSPWENPVSLSDCTVPVKPTKPKPRLCFWEHALGLICVCNGYSLFHTLRPHPTFEANA